MATLTIRHVPDEVHRAIRVSAARCYAELACKARAKERGFPSPDGYIAAIASSRGFTVATRDTAAFEAAGLSIVNPWQGADSTRMG